jgi:DNA-binding IclR family transcriptional regulator
VRRDAFALTTKSWSWGCAAWRAGIYDDQGKLVAGLSISAPASRLEEAWLPKLKATAEQISRSLGFSR